MKWIGPAAGFGLLLLGALPLGADTAALLPQAQSQFTDSNGKPLAGGSVKFCVPNTACATLKATWSDPGETQANPNPVMLDGAGRATIFGSGQYEMQVFDFFGQQIYTGLTSAVAGQILSNAPAGSVLGNPAATSGAPSAVPVQAPVAFISGKLGFREALVTDTSNQTVDPTFAYNTRVASGTNPLTYTLQRAKSFYSGFRFTIVAQVVTTINFNVADTVLQGTSPLTLQPGQTLELTTDGNTVWLPQVTRQNTVPVLLAGQVVKMRTQTCPAGTLLEDGTAISRTTYAKLFAALGTTWGTGDGSTTFNLPNSGGQFDRGWVPSQTVDPARVFGSLQLDQFQDHIHSMPNFPIFSNSYALGGTTPATAGASGSTSTGNPTTGRHGTETRPTNLTVLSCVATGDVP